MISPRHTSERWRRLPFGLMALTVAGALLGHEIGYLTEPTTLGHGYLSVAAPLALVGFITVVWRMAIRIVSASDERLPSVPMLTAAQSSLYLSFEIGERIVSDTGSSLWSVPVVAGLVAQPLIAWLALRLLDFGHTVLTTIVNRGASVVVTSHGVLLPIEPMIIRSISAPTLVARGPPRLF